MKKMCTLSVVFPLFCPTPVCVYVYTHTEILTFVDLFTALHFTATSAPPAARCIRILPMNNYAWWLIMFGIKGSDSIMLHGEQCDSSMGICLWFVTSGQQLSAPLAICPELQIVSSVFRHGAVYLEQHVFLYDTYVKYGSARKCRQKFWHKFCDERVPSIQTVHNLMNKLRSMGVLIDKKQKHKRRLLTEEKFDDTWARLEHT
jgi:hypothetical protein